MAGAPAAQRQLLAAATAGRLQRDANGVDWLHRGRNPHMPVASKSRASRVAMQALIDAGAIRLDGEHWRAVSDVAD